MKNPLLSELHDQAVRDLAWVIGSPGLLDPAFKDFQGRIVSDLFCRDALKGASDWLRELDRHPAPLHVFIQSHSFRRLGRYFELLVTFWLQQVPGLVFEGIHIPVNREKVTIGEFDFVFQCDKWGGLLHWETTVKYYLKATQHGKWHCYLGPSARDRLDLKIHKVIDRQLRLGETPEGRAALEIGDRAIAPQTFFKGYLFYPLGDDLGSVPISEGLSPDHLRGWWFRYGAGSISPQRGGARWRMLDRLAWLSPCRLQAGQEDMGDDLEGIQGKIEQHFFRSGSALLIAELEPNQYGGWDEVSRGFIVPANWPNMANEAG